jgi:hypothetical protein
MWMVYGPRDRGADALGVSHCSGTQPSWLAAWSRFSGVGGNNVPTLHSAPAAR